MDSVKQVLMNNRMLGSKLEVRRLNPHTMILKIIDNGILNLRGSERNFHAVIINL